MSGTLVPAALDPSLFIPELKSRRRDSALAELVECARRAGVVWHADLLLELLGYREALGSSAPGRAIAIPAVRSLAVREQRVVVGRSRRGIDWQASDGLPVRVVALLLSPADCTAALHVESVKRLAATLRLQRMRQRVIDAEGYDDVAATLREALP